VLDMFTAWPENRAPTENWEAAHWNNLFRTLEMNKGRRLLAHIFKERWDDIEPKLSPERRQKMLDIFLDFLPRLDPDAAMKWTERLEQQARDREEAAMMQIRRAEIALYYKGDPEAARACLTPILRRRSEDEPSEWARIRFGDIEFLAGDLDRATLLYGDVQDRAQVELGDMTGARPAAPARSANPADRLSTPGLARSRAELDTRRRASREEGNARGGGFTVSTPDTVEDWKKNAIVDAAASETIRNLLEQDYLYEGLQALRNWERYFPLSKVSSDFILREAQYYMAVEDWRRAAAILEAYVDQVDASSFIPDAVDALLKCKIRLNEPKESIDAFIADMKKKLEFHPIGHSLDSLRYRYEAGRD